MTKSDRRCANPKCPVFGEATRLLVCRNCHRATFLSIYRPRVPARRYRERSAVQSRRWPISPASGVHEEVVKHKGPGEDRDDPHHEAVHEHEERAEPDNVAYQRHGHEEFDEAVGEAVHAEHVFDEAVDEAEHLTDG